MRGKLLLLGILFAFIFLKILHIYQEDLRIYLLSTTTALSNFQSYMLGLAIPEAVYISMIWNPSTKRPHNPFSNEFMSYSTFAIAGAGIAILGWYLSTYEIIPFLDSYYSSYLVNFQNLLLYGTLSIVSIVTLPIICFAIASPAKTSSVLKSIKEHL